MEMSLEPVPGHSTVNAEDVKRLRYKIGKWFALLFLLSIIAPALVYMGILLFPVENNEYLASDLPRAVFWKGKFWFVSSNELNMLNAVDASSLSCSPVVSLPTCSYPHLLPGNDELWMPTRQRLGVYRDGRFSEYPVKEQNAAVKRIADEGKWTIRSNYFLYGGQPAWIKGETGEWSLMAWHDGSWIEARTIALPEFKDSESTRSLLSGKSPYPAPPSPGMKRLRPRPDIRDVGLKCFLLQDVLHLFLQVPDPLLSGVYHASIPLSGDSSRGAVRTWESLDFEGLNLFSFALEEKIFLAGKSNYGFRLNFFSLENDEWKSMFSSRCESEVLSVFPMTNRVEFLFLTNYEGDLVRVVLDRAGREIGRQRVRIGGMWKKRFAEKIGMIMVICAAGTMAFIALIIGSCFHRKMKRRIFCDDRGYEFLTASILRRGSAQLIDLLFLLLPLGVFFIVVKTSLVAAPPIHIFFATFWLNLDDSVSVTGGGTILLFVVWLMVIAFLEGRFGVSPGKMMLGLRLVDEEGKRCGFRNAFLRNVMKNGIFVAMPLAAVFLTGGFFILQLNALVAALSEQGQHIGDLVVSSLVVRRVKARPEPKL